MNGIEITEGVPPEYAIRAQQHYVEHYLVVHEPCVREVYGSPDKAKCLFLKQRGEKPFGFAYFSGRVCRLHGGSVPGKTLRRFWLRRLLSPGTFGRHYDHWSGSPWSPDADYLALAETAGAKFEAFKIRLVQCASGRIVTIAKSGDLLTHHMWSSAGDYLFRSMTSWHLYSRKSKEVRIVYKGSSYPKHCYFEHSGDGLILLDDEWMTRLLACDSLKPIASVSVREYLHGDEQINYSLLDPFENQVLLAVDAQFGMLARSDRWLAVKVKN